MNNIINEEYIKSQAFTYEDILEGYKRSLKILKRINKKDYENIVKLINKTYKNNPEKFKQFVQDVKLKAKGELVNLNKYNFLEDMNINIFSCIFGLNLADLSASTPYSIDVSSLNGSLVFPFSDITYTLYPLLDYKNIKEGFASGLAIVDKTKTTTFLGKEKTSTTTYAIYKNNNKFYVKKVSGYNQKNKKLNTSKITKDTINLSKEVLDIVK